MSNSLKLSSHPTCFESSLSNYEAISISIYFDIDLKSPPNTAKLAAFKYTVESTAWLQLH
jgi:hypothetical protein